MTVIGSNEKTSGRQECPICGGQVDIWPWQGMECRNCGSISVTHLPDPDELNKYYQSFSTTYHGGGREKGALKRQNKYASRYLQLVKKYCKSGSVLDIGPANSPFPNMLQNAGFLVAVADFVRPSDLDTRIKFLEITPEDYHAFIRTAGLGGYDVVTSFAVIEHTRQPKEWVNMMVAITRPGGHLILTTPEIGHFSDRNALGCSRWFCPPERLHLISNRGMRHLFEEAGCTTIHTGRFELNSARWMARYGQLAAEGVSGLCIRSLSPVAWRRAREQKFAKGQGIASYVFKKDSVL